MQSKSDAQLLREYADRGVEAAFAEIVHRHTNLVYSAALRQVNSPDTAPEIAQNVFIGLAHGAHTLSAQLTAEASLAGWLCRSARNQALKLWRDESRRHSRERQAMELLNPISESAPDWESLRPVLDEAMAELTEPEYDALVLRFFNNHDLRAVGRALGVSDDTAQKRVSRALDKLRENLARRGVATTGAALSLAISANAVQAAPVGLALSISTAATLAGKTIAATATATATKAIAMTILQKTLITATIVAAVSTGIYEARQASSLRDQVQSLQQQQALLAEQLQQKRDGATSRLAALLAENEQLKSKQNTTELLKLRGEVTLLRAATAQKNSDPTESEAKSWLTRVNQLKQRLEQTSSAKIPELKYLTEQDWLNVARSDAKSEKDFRLAFSSLRTAAEWQVAHMLQDAMNKYSQSNSGQFASDLPQLQSYLDSPIDDAILQRYAIVASGSLPQLKLGGDWMIALTAPVDAQYDNQIAISANGSGSTSFQGSTEIATLTPALKAYATANNGQEPKNPSDLLPYLTTPEQQAAFQKLEQMRNPASK